MNTQPASTEPSPDGPQKNGAPNQLALADLLSLTLLAAVLLAIFAPIVRVGPKLPLTVLMGLIVIYVATIGISIWLQIRKRVQLLRQAGDRFGTGNALHSTWKYWPWVYSFLILLLYSALLLAHGLYILRLASHELSKGKETWSIFLPTLQATILFLYSIGQWLCRFIWKLPPYAIEFYENGCVVSGNRFYAWSNVSIRKSEFFPDRITVVLRGENQNEKATASEGLLVQTSDAVRDRLWCIHLNAG